MGELLEAIRACAGLLVDAGHFWVREVWCRTLAGHSYREGVCRRCSDTLW